MSAAAKRRTEGEQVRSRAVPAHSTQGQLTLAGAATAAYRSTKNGGRSAAARGRGGESRSDSQLILRKQQERAGRRSNTDQDQGAAAATAA